MVWIYSAMCVFVCMYMVVGGVLNLLVILLTTEVLMHNYWMLNLIEYSEYGLQPCQTEYITQILLIQEIGCTFLKLTNWTLSIKFWAGLAISNKCHTPKPWVRLLYTKNHLPILHTDPHELQSNITSESAHIHCVPFVNIVNLSDDFYPLLLSSVS